MDVLGQEIARRALVVACAGGHNVPMKGSPGVGKTLLATALPSNMPKLSLAVERMGLSGGPIIGN